MNAGIAAADLRVRGGFLLPAPASCGTLSEPNILWMISSLLLLVVADTWDQ